MVTVEDLIEEVINEGYIKLSRVKGSKLADPREPEDPKHGWELKSSKLGDLGHIKYFPPSEDVGAASLESHFEDGSSGIARPKSESDALKLVSKLVAALNSKLTDSYVDAEEWGSYAIEVLRKVPGWKEV